MFWVLKLRGCGYNKGNIIFIYMVYNIELCGYPTSSKIVLLTDDVAINIVVVCNLPQ